MSTDDSAKEGAALHRANAQQARITRLERLRSSGDTSVMGVVVHKVCCICGEVLNHKPRFKDSQGRYWCPTCNEADHEKVMPAPCADCGIEMSRRDMKEVNGLLLCPVCVEKCAHESRAVVEMRLRGLSHGHEKEHKATHTAAKVQASYKKSNRTLMIVIGVLVALAIIAVLIMLRG